MNYLKWEIIAIETKRKQSIKQFFQADQQYSAWYKYLFIFFFFCRIFCHNGWQTGLSRFVVTAGVA